MYNESTEILIPESPVLVEFIEKSGLDEYRQELLRTNFLPLFQKAEEWAFAAKQLIITDESQTDDMALAREARLELKNIRVSAEKVRVELKRPVLEEGRAIDGIYKILEGIILDPENHLYEQENYIARKKQKAIKELFNYRYEILKAKGYMEMTNSNHPTHIALPLGDALGTMTQKEFDDFISNTDSYIEFLKQKNIKEENERIEKQAEFERIKAENARLVAERLERERLEGIETNRVIAIGNERKEIIKQLGITIFESPITIGKMSDEEFTNYKDLKINASIADKNRVENERLLKEKLQKETEDRNRIESELKAKKLAEEKERLRIQRESRAAKRAPDVDKIKAYVASVKSIPLPEIKDDQLKQEFEAIHRQLLHELNLISVLANSN